MTPNRSSASTFAALVLVLQGCGSGSTGSNDDGPLTHMTVQQGGAAGTSAAEQGGGAGVGSGVGGSGGLGTGGVSEPVADPSVGGANGLPQQPTDPACVSFMVGHEPPSVELVVDRSSGMDIAFPGANDRWQAIVDVLATPEIGLVDLFQGKIEFGLTTFSGDLPECPALVGVGISPTSSSAIKDILSTTALGQDRPTRESLVLASSKLGAHLSAAEAARSRSC